MGSVRKEKMTGFILDTGIEEQGSVTCSVRGWASCYSHRPQRLAVIWSSVHVYGIHKCIKILFHLLIFIADITISI